MAKQQKQNKKPPVQVKKPVKQASKTLFENLEATFQKNQRLIFFIIIGLSCLFGALLFDVKVSEGNDDSEYIEVGYDFSRDVHNLSLGKAPLYPMILSIPIRIAGINLVMLKCLSLIFSVLQLVFLYFAFRKRLPLLVLFPVLFLVAVNASFQYFASQTYTEAFFLMLQALFVWTFIKIYEHDTTTAEKKIIPSNWRQWLALGFLIIALTLSRNIAVVSILAVVFYFVINKQFRQAAYTVVAYVAFRIPFELMRTMFWNKTNQYQSQMEILLRKDPYDPSKGLEDFSGFMTRFFQNIELYISKRFFQILEFRSMDAVTVKPGLSFLFFVIFFLCIFFIIRNKNKIMLFISCYVTIMMFATFAVLQTRWDQPRMVMVYIPFILLIITYAIHSRLRNSFAQFFYLVFIVILLGASLFATIGKAEKHYSILKKNVAGDLYYGYTPDWVNYLKMSRYCGDSLPPNSLVACRKAPMSFVYGKGRKFYGMYSVVSTDPDTMLAIFKRDSVTHAILASLRRDPKREDGNVINTIHRMLYPIEQKYPGKLVMIKQIGETEPAYLYKINY